MRIPLLIDSHVLVDSLASSLPEDELAQLIIRLDCRVGTVDFTEKLFDYFAKEMKIEFKHEAEDLRKENEYLRSEVLRLARKTGIDKDG